MIPRVLSVGAIATILLSAACGGTQRGEARAAEMVLIDGTVITMDDAQPRARAIAIAGGVIVAVGDDVAAWIGPKTRVIDLAGRTVTPGLVDGHCHLYGLGTSLEIVSLREVGSELEAAAIVARAAAERGPGEWVIGRGWDQNRWGGTFPTHASLDAAVPDLPVSMRRVDGHALWANAVALGIAGITRDTPDPAGGRIERDDRGEPTGVLIDNAMDLVERHFPEPSDAVIERRIRAGAAFAIERGITGVHDMGIDDPVAAVYRRMAAAGELPLRVNAYTSGDPAVAARLAGAPPTELDDGDAWFSMRGVKIYADGALGSRGAELAEEYSDDPGNHGNWVTSPPELRQAILDAAHGGWQVAVHAIGDAAIHVVLDHYAEADAPELRPRIEHVQVIAPADVPRFAELGVMASMQPSHATSDMPWAEDRVGAERIQGGYAWRTLIDAGATVVGGSDFPVEEVGPLLQIYAAVTRQDTDGNPPGGWYPAQRMTLDEALRAYTVAPAYAAFVEEHRGRVKVGMAADLTVVSIPLAADRTLLDARIDYTIVGGRVELER